MALVIGLLDHFGVQQAILVGNSAGGTVAMQTALAHPERVSALVLVDPAVYSGGGAPAWMRPLLQHAADAPPGAAVCSPDPGAWAGADRAGLARPGAALSQRRSSFTKSRSRLKIGIRPCGSSPSPAAPLAWLNI